MAAFTSTGTTASKRIAPDIFMADEMIGRTSSVVRRPHDSEEAIRRKPLNHRPVGAIRDDGEIESRDLNRSIAGADKNLDTPAFIHKIK